MAGPNTIGRLAVITGADVDVDADKLAVVDISAGVNGTKSITVKELIANTSSFLPSGPGAVARPTQNKLREFAGSPQDYDGLGDDSNDDSASINSALAAKRTVLLPAATYRQTSGSGTTTDSRNVIGEGRNSVLNLNHSTFPNNSNLQYSSTGGSTHTFTGALTAGQKTFTVNTVAGLAVGDQVFVRAGVDPNDANEEQLRFWNIIEGISGSDVTLRIPLPEACSNATHVLRKFATIAENFLVENLAINYVGGIVPGSHITVTAARNAQLRNIFSVKNAGEVVSVIESENISVENVYSQRADRSVHGSAGRVIGGWGMRNCSFKNIHAQDCDSAAVFLESLCRGVLIDGLHVQSGPGTAASEPAIQVAGGSKGVLIRNYHFWSETARPALNVVQSSEVETENVYLYRGNAAFPLRNHKGILQHNDGSGVAHVYNQHRTHSRRIKLEKSMSANTFALPTGVYKRIQVFVNSTTGITNFLIENTSSQGQDVVSFLTANTMQDIESSTPNLTNIGNNYPFNSVAAKRAKITTDTSIPADAYAVIIVDYISENTLEDDAIQGHAHSQAGQQELHGSLIIDEGNTTGTVTFSIAMSNTAYYVLVTPAGKSGAPAAASNRVESISKATGSFTVTLEAAPGAGTSRTFDWWVIR